MSGLVTVKRISIRRFVDVHKNEILIALQLPLGAFLLFYGFFFMAPVAIAAFLAGGADAVIWAVFHVAVCLLFMALGIKMIVCGSLQLMIVRGLRSMQFATTKKICLNSLLFLSKWPLVHSIELGFFEVALAGVCMGRADYEGAESLYATAAERYRKRIERLKGRFQGKLIPSLIVILTCRARANAAMSRIVEAENDCNEALELLRGLGGNKYARMEAFPTAVLGYTHLRAGALTEAESEYKRAFRIIEATPVPPVYGSASFEPILMGSCLGMAIIAMKNGTSEESLDYWSDFVKRGKQVTSPMSPNFMRSLYVLANEYMNNKLFGEAETVLDTAYAIAMQHFDHPDAKETQNYFEKLLLLTNRQSEVGDMRAWLRLSQPARID